MHRKVRSALIAAALLLTALHRGQNLVWDGDFKRPFISDTAGPGRHKCGAKETPDFFDSLSASVFNEYPGGTSSYSGHSHRGTFCLPKDP